MNYYFAIDPHTREIWKKESEFDFIPEQRLPEIHVADDDAHRLYFDLSHFPICAGNSIYDEILIHYISESTNGYCKADVSDSYKLNLCDGTHAFRWLLPHNAIKKSGKLTFIISFVRLDYNNNIKYEWRSKPYTLRIIANDTREIIIRNYMYNCPNCGAPITGDKCEYCGTVLAGYFRI